MYLILAMLYPSLIYLFLIQYGSLDVSDFSHVIPIFDLFVFNTGVHVTDLGSPTALSNSTNVTILILPVNEFPPQLTHEHSARVSIVENQEVGSGLVLFDINATDKDFGEQGNAWEGLGYEIRELRCFEE